MIYLRMILCLFLAAGVMGCASMKKNTVSNEELQMRIGDLERRVQERDDQIRTLESRLEDTHKVEVTKVAQKPGGKATTREIQVALKSAGYYAGAVDGKIGQLTKSAVKAFQKDNGLKEDGVVGQQTWAKLSEHLQ